MFVHKNYNNSQSICSHKQNNLMPSENKKEKYDGKRKRQIKIGFPIIARLKEEKKKG